MSCSSSPHTGRGIRGNVARVVALAGAFAALPSAFAQQPAGTPTTLAPIVVTGSRTPTPISESLADVSVITREELDTAGQTSLVELLRRQRGFEFSTNGGPGSTTGVFVRGSNNAQVLVLIDGQRMGSSTSGGAAWHAIPLEQIERVEILRGPASSLYGADAIGGVVQIFTRQGDGAPRVDAEGGAGSYDTWRAGAGFSGSTERFHYSVRGGREDSGGFNAIRNPNAFGFNADRDGYRNENAAARLGFTLARGHELGLQALESRTNAQFDTSANFDDRTKTTVRAAQFTSANQITASWRSHLRLGETADQSESRTAFGTTRFDSKQRQYAWQNDFRLGGLKLQLAAERREEHVVSTTLFSTNQRDTDSGVAVLQWAPGQHLFQASGRYDHSNQFGSRSTGALAYGYRLGGGWRATAGAGTAFRVPTFNDLYFPTFDNPTLTPEKAKNIEAGLHYDGARFEASAVYYRNRVENLIAFSGVCPLAGRPFGCPVNINRALLEGVSLSAQARISQAWSVRGTLDLADPQDRATGNLLPRRAKQFGSASVDYSLGAMRLSTEVIAAGRRFDNVANTQRMAGYAIWNLLASYRLNRQWSLYARWNNVFDKEYELATNFATPGSNVFVGVRYQ